MDNNIFRKKTVDRITSPEELDNFIHVIRPRTWLILAAGAVLMAGVLAWACLGEVQMTDADGASHTVHPISLAVNSYGRR